MQVVRHGVGSTVLHGSILVVRMRSLCQKDTCSSRKEPGPLPLVSIATLMHKDQELNDLSCSTLTIPIPIVVVISGSCMDRSRILSGS